MANTAWPGWVFVTVGTTQFDALIDTVLAPEFAATLRDQGYRKMVVQYGRFQGKVVLPKIDGLEIEAYDYKPSLKDDMAGASLVISHAGAGTVLEALEAGRRLIVVVNETLMGNHQEELAEAMAAKGFLLFGTCATLPARLEEMETATLAPYVRGRPELFAAFLDSVMA